MSEVVFFFAVLLILASSTALTLKLFMSKWEWGRWESDGEPTGERPHRAGACQQTPRFPSGKLQLLARGRPRVWGSLKTSRTELPCPTTLQCGMKYLFSKDQILLTIFSQHSFFLISPLFIIFSWVLIFFGIRKADYIK